MSSVSTIVGWLTATVLCCLFAAYPAFGAPTLADLSRNPVLPYKKGSRHLIAQGTTGNTTTVQQDIPELRGLGKNTPEERKQIEELADQATITEGAMFVTPEKVLVKKPVLTALITLDRELPSPYTLEALDSKDIQLREILGLARENNLEIKINAADMDARKWQYIGSIGGFLPSFANDYQMQALNGQYVSASGLTLPIKNLYLTSSNSFQQYLYKGGSILHTYLQAKHNYRASKYGVNRAMADVLTDAATDYHNLVLADVLLQIRVKAVQVAEGLVILNKDLFEDGVNTKLDVLQAEYELSRNRQNLIEQQVKRREAAVKLATSLNINPSMDLVISDRLVSKARLIEASAKITDLVSVAIDNRPELKRYEQLRLAALEQIKIARSALLPSISTTGTIVGSSARVFSQSSSSNSGSTSLSTGGGAGVGGVSGASSLPLSGTNTGGKHWTAKSLFLIGLDANWQVGGASVTEIGAINSARAEARKAQLEFNRELTFVYRDVHDQYLASLSADNMIRETTDAVTYAEEGLRVAQVRFTEGVGTYIDVINAQRGYTDALISKAQALIDFNIAQTKLVRAVGRVSVDTLATTESVRVR
jgi:outer membrane protein TolC